MPLAPSPWLITGLTPEVIKALDGSIQTGAGRDGSRAPGLALPAAPSFTVSKTATSVTAIITNANGATSYEFSVNGTTWVSGVTVSGLTAATPYDFRGRGINASGTGPSSAVVTVTTNAGAVSNSAWQSVLETNFFRADSFDDTEDWNPIVAEDDLENPYPVKTNSQQSIWSRYTNDRNAWGLANIVGSVPIGAQVTFSNGATTTVYRAFSEDGKYYICTVGGNSLLASVQEGNTVSLGGFSATISHIPKWIGDEHPTYRDRGKSLCINYNNFNKGVDGFGPSRLAVYFGDGTSNSGLQKVHLFFMMKFDPAFFAENLDGTFRYAGIHKFFDVCSGFTEANNWGSPEERATVYTTFEILKEYGANYSIINTAGGGLSRANSIAFAENARMAELESNGFYNRQWVNGIESRELRNSPPNNVTEIDEFTQNDKWFGAEFALDLGTVDQADGSIELWLYDEHGNDAGHFVGPTSKRLVHFDHKYNLITLGGNRICDGYGDCPVDAHSRIYIDDFILHTDRIAPTYFQLLTDFEGPL